MLSRSLLSGAGALLTLKLLGGMPAVSAQPRFETLSSDIIPSMPGVQVNIIRDNVLNACYTAFVKEGVLPIGDARVGLPDLRAAADARDRQLADLSATFDSGVWNQIPGTPGPSRLRYEWEGEKVLDDFSLAVLDQEFARLERQLERLVESSRVVAVSPVPCSRGSAGKTP